MNEHRDRRLAALVEVDLLEAVTEADFEHACAELKLFVQHTPIERGDVAVDRPFDFGRPVPGWPSPGATA